MAVQTSLRVTEPLRIHARLGVALAAAVVAISGCGGDDSGNAGGGGVSFADGKREVARLVDETYDSVLSDLMPRIFPSNALPCRSAGGGGPATGEYSPGGSLEFDVPKDPQSKRMVKQVAEHWRERGFDNVEVDPIGESVLAQTGEYRLSFEVTPKVGRAELGASGPCAKPGSESERDSPPEFRSLRGRES